MNFSITPKDIAADDFIAGTEALARHLDKETAIELKRCVKDCLMDAKPPKPNLTRDQNRALKELCKDDSIVILPADKGKAVVVMDAPEYQRKIDETLSDDRYTMLSKDPTKKLEAKLSKILMNLCKIGDLPSELRRRLTPAQSYTPQLYGLPKIHKEEIPLRPIVSTIGSPCYLVAKHLARILTPLVGQRDSHIKNSEQFVQLVQNTEINDRDRLVSFDVCNLSPWYLLMRSYRLCTRNWKRMRTLKRDLPSPYRPFAS